MIIKAVGFGNKNEAFIENRFKNKVNIIFSNLNNRGKTLLMQSMVYSIGYESIFPTGFDSKKYFYYSKIQIENREYEFLRKGNSIISLSEDDLYISDTISDFKYYFNNHIYKLPEIFKDNRLKLTDLSLFYEIFFLGQDKRNTSNIIIKGQNNKIDFNNMVFSIMNLPTTIENTSDLESLAKEKKSLEEEIQAQSRKITILQSHNDIANFISSAANNIEFKAISTKLKEKHSNISQYKKDRNREQNRKINLENLISELTSLNRDLNKGTIKCIDCGSENLSFSNKDFEFEISNKFVRQNIINSIYENIRNKIEIVEELNNSIITEQKSIESLLETLTPDEKNYIIFQDEINNSKNINDTVLDLQTKLDLVESRISQNEKTISFNKDAQKVVLVNILEEMRKLYSKIAPFGLSEFRDIFTKSTETFSGSEGQEFYFCKLLALNNILNHKFPIIIDSFREGELSSATEELMIKEFIKLNKQVILTSTLKKEEYNSDKYYDIDGINVLDYSKMPDSRILNQRDIPDFIEIIRKFGISLA